MNRNVYATILIILAIGIYFTVTKGILAEAGLVRADNAKYISAIESAKDLISVRDKLLAEYKNLSVTDRTNLDKMVPKSIDNIRLIIDMNNIALRHGFSLKGIKVSSASTDKKSGSSAGSSQGSSPVASSLNASGLTTVASPILEKATVTFGVSATYQQFIIFLQDLESSLRILDVSHLSVTADDKGVYDWSVELQTYWLRNQ